MENTKLIQKKVRERERSQEQVAHACNPSCSVGRDQEDCDSKSAQAK
jgi:hypothetical protein